MSKGLYIHIPFCMKKCKYCDFVSFECGDKDAYIDALINELKQYKGTEIDTVFIGGGTPTTLDLWQIEKLFTHINSTFIITKDAEWTVEANPSTFDTEKLKLMKSLGANRLSVGVQSFSDNELRALGRIHTAEKAKEAIELAKAHFENINIDIISAVPNQTRESFISTLETALSLEPTHISCYSLILEEGTPLFNEYELGKLILPDEDTEREIYDTACERLEKAGYMQYEISNFAKAGYECRHNLKYWHLNDYIGAGVAAHSLLDGTRRENTCNLKRYISGEYVDIEEKLTAKDIRFEFIIMTLRLTDGLSGKEYYERFGSDFYTDYKEQIDKFINLGLMMRTERGFALTKRGISLSNSVLCEFA